MSRLLLLAALTAVLLVPAAMAAPGDPTVTVSITNLPANVSASNGTAYVDLKVSVQVDNVACLPGPGKLTVSLAASSSGGNITGQLPSSVDVNLPPAALSVSNNIPITVVLRASGAASGNVTITPTYAISGCTGTTASGAGTPGSFPVTFKPSSGTTAVVGNDDAPVPGLELPVLAIAIVALALVLRRKA